ncbi:MAG: UvrB/UvrC motif-containing protein [Planctomycetota bacterium]
MKRKCDLCSRPATHHSVEIVNGQKIEKHLCAFHAEQEGLTVKAQHQPINELLTNFVKLNAGVDAEPDESGTAGGQAKELACDQCGITYAQFRESTLLGCPRCYTVFEKPLGNLLERAHEGATHHIGKVPARAGVGEQRQEQLTRLRRRLHDAVDAEDYELAVKLRDELTTLEDAAS